MREHGMLFKDEMVRAILAGRKTQTRRLDDERTARIAVGDRIWVREAWKSWDENHCRQHEDNLEGDDGCTAHCDQTYVAYRATPRIGYRPEPDKARITYLDESFPLADDMRVMGPWRSALFMPRWASRITLEVVDVRVQRLQEITDDDARAEGVERDTSPCDHTRILCDEIGCLGPTCRSSFAELWNGINGKRRDGAASWRGNPRVRAFTFGVVA